MKLKKKFLILQSVSRWICILVPYFVNSNHVNLKLYYARFPSWLWLTSLSPPIFQVIALYDYDAQGDQELYLEEGDIITVIAKEDDVWWCGQCKGKMGMFPSNYVEAYDEGMWLSHDHHVTLVVCIIYAGTH